MKDEFKASFNQVLDLIVNRMKENKHLSL